MMDKFLALGFRNVGHFTLNNNELSFERIQEEYNPSNILWVVVTNKHALYVGETVDPMNIVLKDLVRGNENRATRNRIHTLIKEYSQNSVVHFLVDEVSKYSKQDLIEKFSPVGNINGK
jgi:hypothetical protein